MDEVLQDFPSPEFIKARRRIRGICSPKLGPWRLSRFAQSRYQKFVLLVNGPVSPQLNPVYQQKTMNFFNPKTPNPAEATKNFRGISNVLRATNLLAHFKKSKLLGRF
jgi:hypothetical protein